MCGKCLDNVISGKALKRNTTQKNYKISYSVKKQSMLCTVLFCLVDKCVGWVCVKKSNTKPYHHICLIVEYFFFHS